MREPSPRYRRDKKVGFEPERNLAGIYWSGNVVASPQPPNLHGQARTMNSHSGAKWARWAIILLAISCSKVTASDLDKTLDQIRLKNNVAGLHIVTFKHGHYRGISLGVANRQSKQALQPEHYIRLGSVSKLFLGLTSLGLERTGTIRLDVPIDKWGQAPLNNPWHGSHPVTLAQLLEHTAGFTDMSAAEWNSKSPLSLKEALAVDPSSRRVKWRPGEHSSYSNSGAGVAALVIEKATGRDYRKLVQKAVFDPLGLESATYNYTDSVKKDLITGYDTDGVTPIPYWHTLYPAFGGINLRIKHMSNLLAFFSNNGAVANRQVFSPKEMRRIRTPTTTLAAKSGLEHGYGLGLYAYSSNGIELVGHGGDADGYLTHIAFSKDIGVGYFVVINAFNHRAMRRIKSAVEEHLIRDLNKPEPLSSFSLSENRIKALTGAYEPVTHRFKKGISMEIFSRSAALFTKINNTVRPLIAVSNIHFRRPWEPNATIAIIESNDERYFQSDAGNYRWVGDPSAE